MSTREKETDKITKMYSKYLNGPLGKGVMQHLKEGESFTIRSRDEFVRISKQQGKAVVRIVENDAEPSDFTNNHQEF